MKNANEYYKSRQIDRQLNIKTIGMTIEDIVKARTTADEKKRIQEARMDAILNKPLYGLKDIKERFSLSWNELRKIVMNF